MDFAVRVKDSANPLWVLAVDAVGDRLLLGYDDRSLRWVPMSDCTVFHVANPTQPRPVVVTQQQKPKLDLPLLQFKGNNHGR